MPAEAKNAAGAIHDLAQINTAERLTSLLITADISIEATIALHRITLRHTWTSAEQEVLRALLIKRGIQPRPNTLNQMCLAWTDLSAWGEQYLQALTTYYQVFFKEEEERIRPSLQMALQQAKRWSMLVPLQQLLQELSHGVHFERASIAREIILIPSF